MHPLLDGRPGHCADAGGQSDQRGVAPLNGAVERVADRAGHRGDRDRAERRRHRRPFREAREEEEQRHGDQPAADAEQRAEEAGDDPDDRKTEHRSYRMGVNALARLREDPGGAAILLDIDGTLAPIVARPEDSAVPDETREVLRGLVDRYRSEEHTSELQSRNDISYA